MHHPKYYTQMYPIPNINLVSGPNCPRPKYLGPNQLQSNIPRTVSPPPYKCHQETPESVHGWRDQKKARPCIRKHDFHNSCIRKHDFHNWSCLRMTLTFNQLAGTFYFSAKAFRAGLTQLSSQPSNWIYDMISSYQRRQCNLMTRNPAKIRQRTPKLTLKHLKSCFLANCRLQIASCKFQLDCLFVCRQINIIMLHIQTSYRFNFTYRF